MFKTIVTALAQTASDVAAKQKVENQFAQTFNNTSSPTHALMNEIVAPMAGQYYANATKQQRDAKVQSVVDLFFN